MFHQIYLNVSFREQNLMWANRKFRVLQVILNRLQSSADFVWCTNKKDTAGKSDVPENARV